MKFSLMKVVGLISISFLISTVVFAQNDPSLPGGVVQHKWSIEANAGLSLPLVPSNHVNIGKATNFGFGVRYQPSSSDFGGRLIYDQGNTKDADFPKGNKLTLHRFEIQGIYILNRVLNLPDYAQTEIESYVGIGGILGKSATGSATNKMGSFSIGLKPRLTLLPQLKGFIDAAFRMQFNQKYNYAGQGFSSRDFGALGQISLGLSYDL